MDSFKLHVGWITQKPIDCAYHSLFEWLWVVEYQSHIKRHREIRFPFKRTERKKRLSWCYKSYLYVFSRSCGVCVPYTIRDHNRWHGEKSILLKSHLCERVLALSLPTNLYRSHIKKRKAETKFAWKKWIFHWKIEFDLGMDGEISAIFRLRQIWMCHRKKWLPKWCLCGVSVNLISMKNLQMQILCN